MSVLRKYDITFSKIRVFGNPAKIIDTNNMASFPMVTYLKQNEGDTEWMAELLQLIEQLQLGQISPADVSDEYLENNDVDLYMDESNASFLYIDRNTSWDQPDLIVPLDDFRMLLIEWKAYLERK